MEECAAWSLRYASHLGYRPGMAELFRHSVASADPGAHVHFAKKIGFAAVLDPWIVDRGEDQIAAVGAALRACDMHSGCVVFAPAEAAFSPLWVSEKPGTVDLLLSHVQRSVATAKRINSRVVAVLLKADVDKSAEVQLNIAMRNLRRAADLARDARLTLGIEPLAVRPGMLVREYATAAALVKRVDDPAVKLIFDTGHAYHPEADLGQLFSELYDDICLLQLADQPGRVEPGAGKIDFVDLLSRAVQRGYSELVELEFEWSRPGIEGEERGMARLRALDAAARRVANC